jgi:hypothetical protein
MIATPIRAVAGAPVTVPFAPVDWQGEPSTVDPGTVTVGVVRADASELVAPGAATTVDGVNRSFTLTASHTAQLDRLSVTFTAGAVTHRRTVDIVEARYCSAADVRGVERIPDVNANPNADLFRARDEVEDMFERGIGDRLSFVPRFGIASVDNYAHPYGRQTLNLPHYYLRLVRWVKYVADGTLFEFDPLEVGAVAADESGMATLVSGVWPVGRLLVGYEHGMDAPPADVKRAAVAAIRRQMNLSRSAVDPRAMSITGPGGEVQRFPTPGLGPWITGVPEVDEVIAWYRNAYRPMAVI